MKESGLDQVECSAPAASQPSHWPGGRIMVAPRMAITFFHGITLVVDMDIGFCYVRILTGLAKVGLLRDMPQMIQQGHESVRIPFY